MWSCVILFYTASVHSLFWNRGKGDYFRLGHGTDVHVRKPQMVEGLRGKKIVHVAVGALHCLAVTDAGQVCTDLHHHYKPEHVQALCSFTAMALFQMWLSPPVAGVYWSTLTLTFPGTSDLCCYTAYFILYNTFAQNTFNNVSTSLPMMRDSYSIFDHFKRLLWLSTWRGAFWAHSKGSYTFQQYV